MGFSERSKTIALAIVHIFETAKPFGDYGAVAVLSDGAGFSVGINQFTHRSGSLAKVIMRFMELGGEIQDEISFALPDFKSGKNIAARSADRKLRNALKNLGTDPLWRQAQREIAFEQYLKPALDACAGSKFKHPLSLAVIYDSINQGSFAKVRDKVTTSDSNEKAWIAEYCADRRAFLASSRKPIVRSTVYRPNFFLSLIADGNWDLKLPLNINGHKLTEAILFPNSAASNATLVATPVEDTDSSGTPTSASHPSEPPTTIEQTAGTIVNATSGNEPPAEGGGANDEPVQVSQGGFKSLIATVLGGITSGATAIWGALTSDTGVMIVGIVCVTLLILALIFRQVLMDWLRMNLTADPTKRNVK